MAVEVDLSQSQEKNFLLLPSMLARIDSFGELFNIDLIKACSLLEWYEKSSGPSSVIYHKPRVWRSNDRAIDAVGSTVKWK